MQTLFFALRVRSYPGDVFASFVKIAALNAPRSLTLTTGGGGVCGKNGGGGGGPVCNIRGLESMHFIWFSSNFYSEIKIN
jgi:hypothetical protein